MISQTRDVAVTPTGEGLYTVLHNFTAAQLSTFLHDEMLDPVIGNCVGIFLSGIALSLGISSILLLSSKRSLSRQDHLLRAHTIVLLSIVIAFQIQTLFLTFLPFISLLRPLDKMTEAETKLKVASSATLVVMVGLTDGLLVWRCFMVQKVMGNNPSKWGNLFWIFPLSLWLASIAMASTTTAKISGTDYGIIGASGFIINVLLNLYAAIFISTRLLLHRRAIIAQLGKSVLTGQHVYLIGIFIESAAVNLPVAAACAVGFGFGKLQLISILMPILVANQGLASVLIIHQSALGRILSQQREFEVKVLPEVAGNRASKGPGLTV